MRLLMQRFAPVIGQALGHCIKIRGELIERFCAQEKAVRELGHPGKPDIGTKCGFRGIDVVAVVAPAASGVKAALIGHSL